MIFSTYTTYFLKITSPMTLLDRSFLKQFKTFAVRVLSNLKILGFASYIKHCCSYFKLYSTKIQRTLNNERNDLHQIFSLGCSICQMITPYSARYYSVNGWLQLQTKFWSRQEGRNLSFNIQTKSYNISQPNFAILLILGCSFEL